ncbi:hypothetical protein COCSADRAFT_324310 [Bipolaris sorokiniana ND90Pr]|uniref:Uncharacterized protein n=1 Tax=Cochliobolus sativus (strain ND90Pr / ATCC 201652) TaxID=665912 RepID=M2T522_COCSN|nr:uncharacterized protein COCSADRAFT_324310 [Bipolaris sorokiniana ND90Pr]EMD64356.1 hypothetical protein COCSADRAFT_324310 [Bipolaris sorokiniana ND90Pr]
MADTCKLQRAAFWVGGGQKSGRNRGKISAAGGMRFEECDDMMARKWAWLGVGHFDCRKTGLFRGRRGRGQNVARVLQPNYLVQLGAFFSPPNRTQRSEGRSLAALHCPYPTPSFCPLCFVQKNNPSVSLPAPAAIGLTPSTPRVYTHMRNRR